MKYIIISKSNRHNLPLSGHLSQNDKMIINEKEIMSIPDIQGTLDERVITLKGSQYTVDEIHNIITTESWQIIQ